MTPLAFFNFSLAIFLIVARLFWYYFSVLKYLTLETRFSKFTLLKIYPLILKYFLTHTLTQILLAPRRQYFLSTAKRAKNLISAISACINSSSLSKLSNVKDLSIFFRSSVCGVHIVIKTPSLSFVNFSSTPFFPSHIFTNANFGI